MPSHTIPATQAKVRPRSSPIQSQIRGVCSGFEWRAIPNFLKRWEPCTFAKNQETPFLSLHSFLFISDRVVLDILSFAIMRAKLILLSETRKNRGLFYKKLPSGKFVLSSAGTDTSPGVSNKYQGQPAEYQIIIK